MAIVFFEEKKKQQSLILVFTVVVLATAVVFWAGVLRKPGGLEAPAPLVSQKKVELDFKMLQSQIFSQLELFQEISPFEGMAGRENPFLPYSEGK